MGMAQVLGVFGAGVMLGVAGLMALLGALADRSGDEVGSHFGQVLALLAAMVGVGLLSLAFR